MTKEQVIEKFKLLLEENKISFVIPPIGGTSVTGQGINFHICNSTPAKTTRTYFKVDSLEQAKEIWIKVLSDLPAETEAEKVFDKFVPSDINLGKDLFFSIYPGNK